MQACMPVILSAGEGGGAVKAYPTAAFLPKKGSHVLDDRVDNESAWSLLYASASHMMENEKTFVDLLTNERANK